MRTLSKKVAVAASAIGVTPEALFYGTAIRGDTRRVPRDLGSFMRCMRTGATDDSKSIFNVQPIAVLIGQKGYVRAVEKAVTHLAKQGIKRNALGIAASLGWYGYKCKGHW